MFEARDHFHSFKGKEKKRLNFNAMSDKKRNFSAIVIYGQYISVSHVAA